MLEERAGVTHACLWDEVHSDISSLCRRSNMSARVSVRHATRCDFRHKRGCTLPVGPGLFFACVLLL